jgi:hypothetical protein
VQAAQVQRNKDVVRLVTEKGFNEGDLDGINQYFTPGYEVHAPGVPPLPPGPAAFRAAVMLWREAFPDIQVTVEDVPLHHPRHSHRPADGNAAHRQAGDDQRDVVPPAG